MKMPTAHRIALLFNGNKIYDRDIIAGIAAYLNTTRVSWDLFLEEDFRCRLPGIERWQGDGIIADFDDPAGCAALVTAVMVSIVGSIGFVGLVIPHAVRLLLGTGHSRLLPASALGGALFLIAADVLSRTLIKGQVIPVGVVTALVGAPVFALILIGRRNAR